LCYGHDANDEANDDANADDTEAVERATAKLQPRDDTSICAWIDARRAGRTSIDADPA